MKDLYIKEDLIDNRDKLVIIVHGIAEHQGRYDHVAKALNQAGYNVLRYDQRGHGRSPGKRGWIKSFHELIEDLHELVVKYRESFSNVYLLGHSMGGGVVNMYAATYQDVDGIISCGAASDTPKSAKVLKITGFWYLRGIKVSTKMFANHLSTDPKIKIENLQDPLNLKKMYVALIGEMFIKGARYFKKNIKQYQTPVLIVHGQIDQIVEPKISQSLYEKLALQDKTLKIYPNMKHELLNEVDKHMVIQDMVEWLNKH